jgi:putative ATP-dependent endonuclease of OLD family
LELGRQLQDASPVLKNLAEQLRRVSEAQAGVGSIDLRPLPIRIEELARSVDIMVSSVSGNELPMRFQGLGMRSLAALMVFRAVCELRVGADQGLRPHILTLLEEPEAHLHPQAQAAVRALVEDLPGQPVVATHSDVLIAATDPRNVRVFRVNETGTQIHTLTLDQAKKLAVFRRFVERPLGELFFARFVVFVDGTAERISLPSMLNGPLGRSCTANGITVVDLEGMSRVQLQKAVEALSALGDIPWIVFLDNDASGWDAIKDLKGTDGVELSSGHSQVVVTGDKQLEALLLASGFGDEVQSVANELWPRTEDDPKFPELRLPEAYSDATHDSYLKFLAKNKGWAAEHVVRQAIANGKSMPAPIVELARRINDVLALTDAMDGRTSSTESAK